MASGNVRRTNGFGLSIEVNSRTVPLCYEYYLLPNKAEYKICLHNRRTSSCDAIVRLEGEEVGTWRLPAHESVLIERPINAKRRFTFVKEDSTEGKSEGVNALDRLKNGLIEVTFKPEKPIMRRQRHVSTDDWGVSYNVRMNKLDDDFDIISKTEVNEQYLGAKLKSSSHHIRSGLTILGETSDQRFREVSDLINIDESNITTITGRLVIDTDAPEFTRFVSISNETIQAPVIGPYIPPRLDTRNESFNFSYDIREPHICRVNNCLECCI